MENFRFLLSLSATMLLLFACGKDDDVKMTESTTLLTVKVGASYFRETSKGFLIASKPDGTLLDYKPLKNDSTTVLETNESDISGFTATLLLISSTNSFHRLISIMDMPIAENWWLYPVQPNNGTGMAELVVEGTGMVGQPPFYVSGADAWVIADSSSNYIKANFGLFKNVPNIPALAIYRSALDNKVRYYFDTALPAGQTTTVQHADLPIIESPITIDYGMDSIYRSFISGVVQTPSNEKATLLISQVVEAPTQFVEHYIPEGIFDKYFFYAEGKQPSTGRNFYSFIYADSLVKSFNYPDFKVDVAFLADGFNYSTAADFSQFHIDFTNDQGVYWTVSSPALPNGVFRFPQFPTDLLVDYPELDEPFSHFSTAHLRYEPMRPVSAFYENLFPMPGTPEPAFTRQDLLY
jgi:hypothetical protein